MPAYVDGLRREDGRPRDEDDIEQRQDGQREQQGVSRGRRAEYERDGLDAEETQQFPASGGDEREA
jgi:hypothetical protein